MANPQIGVIILENEPLSAIPNSGMFATLKSNYRFYSNYTGTSNPSLPDYIALTCGGWLGIGAKASPSNSNDNPHSPVAVFPTDQGGWAGSKQNVFHAVQTAGYSWKSYEQRLDSNDVSPNCYTGYGSKFPGYGTRHCPAQFYSNTFAKPVDAPNTNGRYDFSGSNGFIADIANKTLPDFFWVTPTAYNQGHSPSTAANTNSFLAGNNPGSDAVPFPGMTALIQGMRAGGLCLVTYDNPGSGSITAPIYAVVCGPGVTAQTSTTAYSHFSFLQGVGAIFGFAPFNDAGVATAYTNATILPLPPGGVVVGDTTPPTPPTTVTAVANSPTSVTVSWSGATDNVGVTGYTVSRNGTAIATPSASPYTDATASPSTTYTYSVIARDAAGNVSTSKAAAAITTPASTDTQAPTVPTGLTSSSITSSSATLSWTPSTDLGGSGLAGYFVFRDGSQVATVSSPTYTDSSLSPSTTYSYTVKAVDGAGNQSAASTAKSVTTSAIVVGGSVDFRAATDFNSGTTSVSVTPTHKTTGDTMFAHVTATGASAITAPAGWTLVGAANDSTVISVSLYSKTAGATEAAAAWTCAGATSLTCEISYAIGAVTVRVAGTNKSVGTAVVATSGTGLSGLSANDEVCTFISSNAGPRPYPETGCGFGIQTVPHDWESNASITAVEATVGRKIAIAHPQVPWDCHAGVANGDFTLSTAEPRVDYANFRMTYISWPRQLAGANTSEATWQSVFGSTDPNTVMANIAAGNYDAIIDGNANAYKTVGLLTGAAFVIRLFWEQNGGGVQHSIGKSANPTAYVANYNAACQRIISRTFAITKNVYWHCNPQTISAATAPANARNLLYWGDSFADFMGTELYTGTRTITQHMTDSTDGAALYTGYGPGSSHDKFIMAGESGPQNTSDTDAVMAARVQSYIDTIPTYPGLKQFTWWNGNGPNGDSIIADQGTATLAKIKTFISSSYMSPSYDVTWKATS